MDNIESKNGEVIILTKLDKFFAVNRKKADDLIAFPMDVFETREEAVEFAKKYLEEHPETGCIEATYEE